MRRVNCIIIEDEYLARTKIVEFVAQIKTLHTLGAYATIAEATNTQTLESSDILFLDINLPDGDGLALAKNLSGKTQVIFTTAYSEHAVEGFTINATDYLLKPIAFSRFQAAVDKALHQLLAEADQDQFIYLKQGRSLIKCDLTKVSYIKGMEEYLYWYSADRNIITLGSLAETAQELESRYFVRVHRSYIVNLKKLDTINTKTLIVSDEEIPIGPTYSKNFKSAFQAYRKG